MTNTIQKSDIEEIDSTDKVVVVPAVNIPIILKEIKEGRYVEAVGRRKTSTARVRIGPSAKASFIINGKDAKQYFMTDELIKIVNDPFSKSKIPARFAITVLVNGGGIHSQAEAVRHGITRILVTLNDELKPKLKKLGFLKRDPRSKERRKFGLKKARKSPQWSKR